MASTRSVKAFHPFITFIFTYGNDVCSVPFLHGFRHLTVKRVMVMCSTRADTGFQLVTMVAQSVWRLLLNNLSRADALQFTDVLLIGCATR